MPLPRKLCVPRALDSRMILVIVLFVLTSLALWAQRNFLPEAPLPYWVDAVVTLTGGSVLAWLRYLTKGPVGHRKENSL